MISPLADENGSLAHRPNCAREGREASPNEPRICEGVGQLFPLVSRVDGIDNERKGADMPATHDGGRSTHLKDDGVHLQRLGVSNYAKQLDELRL